MVKKGQTDTILLNYFRRYLISDAMSILSSKSGHDSSTNEFQWSTDSNRPLPKLLSKITKSTNRNDEWR